MARIIGANINLTGTTALFAPGTIFQSHDNKTYVYVKASAAIVAADVCTYDETFITVVAPISTSNDAKGDRVGVAPVAVASGEYAWLQTQGVVTLNVLASCAANVRLNTTATVGSLDDDATAGSLPVEGLVLTTARGGTNGTAVGVLAVEAYQGTAI